MKIKDPIPFVSQKQALDNSVTYGYSRPKTDIAWQYRGTTFSGGISVNGKEKFKEHLNIALDSIKHSESSIEIDDPHFYYSSIVIYVGLGRLDQKLNGIVQQSIAYDPDSTTRFTSD